MQTAPMTAALHAGAVARAVRQVRQATVAIRPLRIDQRPYIAEPLLPDINASRRAHCLESSCQWRIEPARWRELRRVGCSTAVGTSFDSARLRNSLARVNPLDVVPPLPEPTTTGCEGAQATRLVATAALRWNALGRQVSTRRRP